MEPPPEKDVSIRKRSALFILLLIIAIGLFFRLCCAGGTFYGRDDGIVQMFVLDSFPSGGLLDGLKRLDHGAVGNPLRLAAYPLGAVLPVLVFFTALLYDLLGISLTEFAWVLPVSLLGALTVLPAYFLLAKLGSRRGALAGAALLSVTPLHVLVSRSVSAAWVPAFFLEILCLLILFGAIQGKKLHRGLFSLCVSIYILSHNQFPSFAPVLFAAAVAYDSSGARFMDKVKNAFRFFLRPGVFLGPLFVLLALYGMHFVFTFLYEPHYRAMGTGVGLIGHMMHRGIEPGFYFREVAANALYGLGVPAFTLVLVSFLAWLLGIGRNSKTWLLVIWGIAYLAPFFFLISPHKTIIKGYMGDGLYPFLFLAGIVFGELLSGGSLRKWAAAGILGAALLFSGISSWVTVFQLQAPGGLTLPRFHGCVQPDTGIKAAGTWFRVNADEGARLFAVGIDPKVAHYYTHRIAYGVLDGTVEESAACFSLVKDYMDYVLLPCQLEGRFPITKFADFRAVATVVDGDKEILRIFGRNPAREPEIILLGPNNKIFDSMFATLKTLSGMPDYVPCKGLGALRTSPGS